ncbi:hypothetical protein CCC_03114 [Paramagnetospirillum magnetotacticum MS-1]|uniref:Uncharacterized protein n=1 Tax=Paramagnetospirillum magnetotacticum MS-1 TaxID=272627 RepID=A0A0C2V612_PARME|nr:hypothetical protein CCC_03114 [Paramagnetospirillum magnetotacticum MS-1]
MTPIMTRFIGIAPLGPASACPAQAIKKPTSVIGKAKMIMNTIVYMSSDG